MQATIIGIDLAKSVFQIHGIDAAHERVLVRQLRRSQMIAFFSKLSPCLVGMEACATAHHWARELTRLGHTVRIIPPIYVKGFVRRSKSDAADAAAICEAVTRPSTRFVPVKCVERQAALAVHRTRDLLIRQRTQLVNALRAHLAEVGIVADTGREGFARLAALVTGDTAVQSLPPALVAALRAMVAQLTCLEQQIAEIDRSIHAQHRASDTSRRLESIPGIGVIGATAVAATVVDPGAFRSGRDFAAWIGLVPRQHSTGGRQRLGSISKQGDRYLRRLLVSGAMAVVRHARRHPLRHPWIIGLLARKPAKVVAVALANKMARIAWALMAKGGTYRAPAALAATA